MRILNVTETYAPFLEFGGPPVKVRALSQGLARRGHQVNVLTHQPPEHFLTVGDYSVEVQHLVLKDLFPAEG